MKINELIDEIRLQARRDILALESCLSAYRDNPTELSRLLGKIEGVKLQRDKVLSILMLESEAA